MLPLTVRNNHLFIENNKQLWLLDTGSPSSFGNQAVLSLAGQEIQLMDNLMGLTAEKLSELAKVECAGLLGMDFLGRFDCIIDCGQQCIELSLNELACPGQIIPMGQMMGVPVVTVTVNEVEYQLFFDTGAQISYLPAAALAGFPFAGKITDFYPVIGEFQVDTFHTELSLGTVRETLCFGTVPSAVQMLLTMTGGVVGILGNEILLNRRVGFFPRRGIVVL